MRLICTSLMVLSSLLLSVLAHAQTMYIDDTLFVPLRSGPSTSYRIIHKGIRSGTSVEVLEADIEGYAKVRTPSGLEGFMPKRYLVAEPIAQVKLDRLEKKHAELARSFQQTKQELNSLQSEHQSLQAQYDATQKQLDASQKELSDIKNISANALSLDQRNRELRESNEQLRNQLELLQVENMRLKDKSESNMLMIGGGLVLLGVLIALILPMIKTSKKSDSWA
ncbi:MAG: TIGR04211 family SH3 domain-containing protein [Oleiphilaceae bacterium]|nr:TIGR04211 family SH3 domain-containing protein [Oleiphilaceae bacterium]